MYYLHYISWTSFYTFHAPCTSGIVNSWGIALFYGILWASVNAIIAYSTFTYSCYVHRFVISIFFNFFHIHFDSPSKIHLNSKQTNHFKEITKIVISGNIYYLNVGDVYTCFLANSPF
jgi:hypothetical protein